jgi:hypothetical protein
MTAPTVARVTVVSTTRRANERTKHTQHDMHMRSATACSPNARFSASLNAAHASMAPRIARKCIKSCVIVLHASRVPSTAAVFRSSSDDVSRLCELSTLTSKPRMSSNTHARAYACPASLASWPSKAVDRDDTLCALCRYHMQRVTTAAETRQRTRTPTHVHVTPAHPRQVQLHGAQIADGCTTQ